MSDSTLRIRLSAAERAGLESACGEEPISTWARAVLLAAAGVAADDTPERALAQRLRGGEAVGAEMTAVREEKRKVVGLRRLPRP
jgi:hypothetical protein